MAVMTLQPYTPSAANVLRSAWMPAPPPESEPAMVSALAGSAKLGPDRGCPESSPDALPRQDAQEPVVAVDRHGVGLVLRQQLLHVVQRVAGVGAELVHDHGGAD